MQYHGKQYIGIRNPLHTESKEWNAESKEWNPEYKEWKLEPKHLLAYLYMGRIICQTDSEKILTLKLFIDNNNNVVVSWRVGASFVVF